MIKFCAFQNILMKSRHVSTLQGLSKGGDVVQKKGIVHKWGTTRDGMGTTRTIRRSDRPPESGAVALFIDAVVHARVLMILRSRDK